MGPEDLLHPAELAPFRNRACAPRAKGREESDERERGWDPADAGVSPNDIQKRPGQDPSAKNNPEVTFLRHSVGLDAGAHGKQKEEGKGSQRSRKIIGEPDGPAFFG